MSGTSADGVDACLVEFPRGRPCVLGHVNQPYSEDLRAAVLQAMAHADLIDAAALDVRLADAYGDAVQALLTETEQATTGVRAIGCHGQTVLHRPAGPYPTSIQLGDPHRLALRTGIDVVADFRRADMAAGGQGAPLAPAFHAATFSHRHQARAVVNIGGIANVTLLPAGEGPIAGFDTGPGNALMDAWIQRHHGLACDHGGRWAAEGHCDSVLLGLLLDDPYFARTPPKSTGREYFHLGWIEARDPALAERSLADVQATLAELTARSIADAVAEHGPGTERLFVCGGGAFNETLLSRLQLALPACRIETTATLGVPPDEVEAVAFAWLAQRRLRGLANNRPEVTGATRPLCLGALVRAPR